jgi:hypothetical protein
MKKPKYTRRPNDRGDRPKPIVWYGKCKVPGCPCETFVGKGSETCFNVTQKNFNGDNYCSHEKEQHQSTIM